MKFFPMKLCEHKFIINDKCRECGKELFEVFVDLQRRLTRAHRKYDIALMFLTSYTYDPYSVLDQEVNKVMASDE